MVQTTAPSLPGPLDPQLPHDYERTRLNLFDGGLNTAAEPEELASNQLAAAQNVYWYDGQLLVDSGYSTIGLAPRDGTPQMAFQAVFYDGTDILFLLTTKTLYYYARSGVAPAWKYAPLRAIATVTQLLAATGASTISVTNSAVFTGYKVANLHANVPLSNGILQLFSIT